MASKLAGAEIRTVETLAEEVIESSKAFERFFQKLKRMRPGSEAYFDLLTELWTEAEVLKTKAEHAKQAVDEFLDLLSKDEDRTAAASRRQV